MNINFEIYRKLEVWSPVIKSGAALCLIRLGRIEEGLPLVKEIYDALTHIKEPRIKNGVYQITA